MKKVKIHIVNGSEGYSLQIIDIDEGSGIRALGPKAWGNPYNTPTIVFDNVDAEQLCKDIMAVAKEIE